jgi:lycopene beta-cyclase
VLVRGGGELRARLVVDASGHRPALVRRPAARLAEQAAFGIMGTFAAPPVRAGQLVLMDYRTAHLPPEELAGPPTFLYAMDLGGGRHFVEETSLAHAPGLPMELLERRLRARLAWMGAEARGIEHVERCLFPMDSPLPDLRQPIFGYGGAASMVHPPTGYQVGSALRRAAPVARAVAAALARPAAGPAEAALAAWGALWPTARVRRRALYLFGLATLTRCDSARLQAFFETFFAQPRRVWAGYLSDTLGTGALLATMLSIFAAAPGPVRAALAGSALANRRALLAAALATPA